MYCSIPSAETYTDAPFPVGAAFPSKSVLLKIRTCPRFTYVGQGEQNNRVVGECGKSNTYECMLCDMCMHNNITCNMCM